MNHPVPTLEEEEGEEEYHNVGIVSKSNRKMVETEAISTPLT
jgi:hypothetical protein